MNSMSAIKVPGPKLVPYIAPKYQNMTGHEIRAACKPTQGAATAFRRAYLEGNLDTSDYFEALRIGMTLADASGDTKIQPNHAAEAIRILEQI